MGAYKKEWADFATSLGAVIVDGINWAWANGFPSKEAAQAFLDKFPDMETRGMYKDTDSNDTYSVRFRL